MSVSEEVLEELLATDREAIKTQRAYRDCLANNRRLQKRVRELENELSLAQIALEQATGEKVRVLHRASERTLDA